MIAILDPVAYVKAYAEGAAFLRRHGRITLEMTFHDLREQFSGQFIGAVWIIIHPIFLTAFFVFLFGFLFGSRIGGTHELPLGYGIYILSGLVPWITVQTSLFPASTAVVNNASLVTHYVFPMEILPVKETLKSLVFWTVGIVAVVGYVFVVEDRVHWTYLLVPVALFHQVLLMVGIGFIVSSVTVFFRDLKDFVVLFSVIGMYLLPVIYLPGWAPAAFQVVLYLNPFSYMVWAYQDALYFGRIEHPASWLVFILFSHAAFAAGYRIFRRLKPQFANVL